MGAPGDGKLFTPTFGEPKRPLAGEPAPAIERYTGPISYRDDTEAAIARADALAAELKRTEQERVQLAAEVNALRGTTALVARGPMALTEAEIDTLVEDVETGLRRARADVAGRRFFVGFVAAVLASIFAASNATAAIVFGIVCVVGLISAIAKFSDGSDAHLVGRMLRDDPRQITGAIANHDEVVISIGVRKFSCASDHADGLCARLLRYVAQAGTK